MGRLLAGSLPLVVALAACGDRGATPTPTADDAPAAPIAAAPTAESGVDVPADLPTVDAALLRRHIAELAGDAYGGRRPGTPGAAATVAYIEAQMKALGLEPAGDAGTYRQTVPMRGITADRERTAAAFVPPHGDAIDLAPGERIVVGSYQEAGTHEFDAELVFVGYGVTAPEEDWDDYADANLRGKIAVVFVGDPPLGDARFGGAAMTYYGRYGYKYERALAAGALGCLVVHETEPASYGWNVVDSSWSGERFGLLEPDGSVPAALGIQGWLHAEAARTLAELVGTSLAGWHEAAIADDFVAQPTGVHLRGQVVTRERELADTNVLGRIPGTTHPDEAFVITAHWDHLGRDPDPDPEDASADAIFNGAIDNASGIAGLLATATTLQRERAAGHGPPRSVVFLATTAEEQGLLGSRYYAAHPLVELAKILGVANLDSMNVHGPTTTVTVVGPGQSTLEDALAKVVAEQGRRIVGDDRPEAGSYYRSDHFPFAQRGVPALFFHGGPDMVDGGRAAGERLAARRSATYHTVDDELDPAWPLTGAVLDVQALAGLVLAVTAAPSPPSFKPASEFASIAR